MQKNSVGSNLDSIHQLVELVFFSFQILPHFAKKIPWPDKKIAYQQEEKNHEQNRYW